MASSSEEIPSYVEKFRLINEPTNHWKARKSFLVNNWNDYPEMQLVSLSMVWANMQFDGCRYARDLMDRVHGMANGITLSDADADEETSGSNTQHSGNQEYQPSVAKRPRLATDSDGSVSNEKQDVGDHPSDLTYGKDVSGKQQIKITQSSVALQLYPSHPRRSNSQFDMKKLCDFCLTFKTMCRNIPSGSSQLTDLFVNRLSVMNLGLRYEIKCIDEKEKHNPKWKAYALFRDTLCVTFVSSSKKLAKEGALNNLSNLLKCHRLIGLIKSTSQEHLGVGAVHEMVFLVPVPGEESITLSQTTEQTGEQKPFTAETILASQPRELAVHMLNCKITAAPKIPNFYLVEFMKERAKYGYENPVSKLVNSASMCKVSLNFTGGKFTSPRGVVGQICSVVLGEHEIATGLALGAREAKHLACHNAIQALQMTHATIRKSDKLERPKVSRDDLTDGPSSAAEEVVPESNVGHKMLKMMGWKGEGVGLGKKEEGIVNPVKAKGNSTQMKGGLGFDLLDLQDPNTKSLDEQKVFRILQDYARSDREEELVFTSELNLNERKKLHEMCNRLGLKSKSKGKGDTRYLVVGRKWDITLLAKTVAEKGGNTGSYQLVGPMFDSGE